MNMYVLISVCNYETSTSFMVHALQIRESVTPPLDAL